jgi:hypothetical protein
MPPPISDYAGLFDLGPPVIPPPTTEPSQPNQPTIRGVSQPGAITATEAGQLSGSRVRPIA